MRKNLKPIISAITLFAATAAFTFTTYATSGLAPRSTGVLEITEDGKTILIDTADIHNNAAAINQINEQIEGLGGLTVKYNAEAGWFYLDADNSGTYTEGDIQLGAVGNAKKTDVLQGKTFSSGVEGVSITGTMPLPISATVESNYSGGDNSGSGASVNITNSSDTTSASGATTINLGVNQSVTLPRGYYNGPVVVRNNVANRGSTDIVLTSSNNLQHFEAGYYQAFNVTTDIQNVAGTLSYTHHIHSLEDANNSEDTDTLDRDSVEEIYTDDYESGVSAGCFTTPYYHVYYSYSYDQTGPCPGRIIGVFADHTGQNQWYTSYHCNYCGEGYGSRGGDHSGDDGPCRRTITQHYSGTVDKWTTTPTTTENGHIVATKYIRSCGRSSGEVTDVHIHY